MRFWPTYGGGETVTRALANEMVNRGNQVYVIYFWDRDEGINDFVDARVETIRIEGMSCVDGSELKKQEYCYLKEKLRGIFEEIKPDVVINQWMPTKIVSLAMKGLNARLIKCHHGAVKYVPTIKSIKQKLFYGVFGKWAGWIRVYPEYKRDVVYSDQWVLLSENLRKDAKKLLWWADDDRLDVIPNPLPYEVAEKEKILDNKKKEVLFVGRVEELKRLSYILDAWKFVEQQEKEWTLRIVGDGPDLPRNKRYVKELGLNNIVFEGYVDARRFMMNASVLVLASNQEGFPMVLLEAQQCGTVPIVTNSFPAASDIIVSEYNGILVENNNISAFAEAILGLIDNQKLCGRMAKNAIKTSKQYSVEKICDEWEEKIKTLPIQRGKEFEMKKRWLFKRK